MYVHIHLPVSSKRLSRPVVPIQPVGRSTIPQRALAKPFQATSVGPLKCLRGFFPLGRVMAGWGTEIGKLDAWKCLEEVFFWLNQKND